MKGDKAPFRCHLGRSRVLATIPLPIDCLVISLAVHSHSASSLILSDVHCYCLGLYQVAEVFYSKTWYMSRTARNRKHNSPRGMVVRIRMLGMGSLGSLTPDINKFHMGHRHSIDIKNLQAEVGPDTRKIFFLACLIQSTSGVNRSKPLLTRHGSAGYIQ